MVATGAALRFGAIGAGAAYRVANDEPSVVGMALQIIKAGGFNPHFLPDRNANSVADGPRTCGVGRPIDDLAAHYHRA